MDKMFLDLSEVKVLQPLEPIPPGWYEVEVENGEVKRSSAGTKMIEWAFKVLGIEFSGHKVFDYMVLEGKGHDIALQRLKSLIIACGEIGNTFSGPEELLGKRFLIKLTIKQDDGYDQRNKVIGFKSLDDKQNKPDSIPF